MPNENKKDFNAMLHNSKDMPKVQIITDPKTIEKYGGCKMYFAPPIAYDMVMKMVPFGNITTVYDIRKYFAKQNGADFTEPMTAGIFVTIAAWASYQRTENETPYWRTLKADGELNDKYPGGVLLQKEKLEAEGHTIIQKGRKNIRFFVKDYENVLFSFDGISFPASGVFTAISRINRMEKLFDEVSAVILNQPNELSSPEMREAIQILSDYYTNGDWLHDYELDEQQLLPPSLKRGVLSQDGLYDLLCEINEKKNAD